MPDQVVDSRPLGGYLLIDVLSLNVVNTDWRDRSITLKDSNS